MEDELVIERFVDLTQLGWPPDSDLASEDHFVRGYIDMRGLTWDDANEALNLERELLACGAGNLAAAEEAVSDEEQFDLYGLDVGVASSVAALSAANCTQIASCNGGVGHHESHPLVAFYCRKGRVRDILKAAELAGCGLVNGDSGLLVLYAVHVDAFMCFAEKLIEMRDSLKPLSRPRSRRNRRSPKRNPNQLTLSRSSRPKRTFTAATMLNLLKVAARSQVTVTLRGIPRAEKSISAQSVSRDWSESDSRQARGGGALLEPVGGVTVTAADASGEWVQTKWDRQEHVKTLTSAVDRKGPQTDGRCTQGHSPLGHIPHQEQEEVALERDSTRWARANRKIDTSPEVRLRSILHRRGYRFLKNSLIRLAGVSVRPDIVFTRVKVAVFVDGCFWHGCPDHGGRPRSNSDYWEAKLAKNVRRDRAVDAWLEAAGWRVVRLWEHVKPAEGADVVAEAVATARATMAPVGAQELRRPPASGEALP